MGFKSFNWTIWVCKFKIKFLDQTIVNMLVGGKSNTFMGIIQGYSEIKLAFRKNGIVINKTYFLKRYFFKIKEYITRNYYF